MHVSGRWMGMSLCPCLVFNKLKPRFYIKSLTAIQAKNASTANKHLYVNQIKNHEHIPKFFNVMYIARRGKNQLFKRAYSKQK